MKSLHSIYSPNFFFREFFFSLLWILNTILQPVNYLEGLSVDIKTQSFSATGINVPLKSFMMQRTFTKSRHREKKPKLGKGKPQRKKQIRQLVLFCDYRVAPCWT